MQSIFFFIYWTICIYLLIIRVISSWIKNCEKPIDHNGSRPNYYIHIKAKWIIQLLYSKMSIMLVNLHIYSRRSIYFMDARLMITCNFRILKMSNSYENCFKLSGKCYWADLSNQYFFHILLFWGLLHLSCMYQIRTVGSVHASNFVCLSILQIQYIFLSTICFDFNIFLTTIAILQACAAVKYNWWWWNDWIGAKCKYFNRPSRLMISESHCSYIYYGGD